MNSEIIKDKNKLGEEIIRQIKITKNTDVKNTNNEEEYVSKFHYKVNKDSELYKNGNVDNIVLEITHLNPIDYKKFHESIMIQSWALDMLGYDMLKDRDIWLEKLRTDNEFKKKLGDLLNSLIPITKEEL